MASKIVRLGSLIKKEKYDKHPTMLREAMIETASLFCYNNIRFLMFSLVEN